MKINIKYLKLRLKSKETVKSRVLTYTYTKDFSTNGGYFSMYIGDFMVELLKAIKSNYIKYENFINYEVMLNSVIVKDLNFYDQQLRITYTFGVLLVRGTIKLPSNHLTISKILNNVHLFKDFRVKTSPKEIKNKCSPLLIKLSSILSSLIIQKRMSLQRHYYKILTAQLDLVFLVFSAFIKSILKQKDFERLNKDFKSFFAYFDHILCKTNIKNVILLVKDCRTVWYCYLSHKFKNLSVQEIKKILFQDKISVKIVKDGLPKVLPVSIRRSLNHINSLDISTELLYSIINTAFSAFRFLTFERKLDFRTIVSPSKATEVVPHRESKRL